MGSVSKASKGGTGVGGGIPHKSSYIWLGSVTILHGICRFLCRAKESRFQFKLPIINYMSTLVYRHIYIYIL